jgi:hypothetical protein
MKKKIFVMGKVYYLAKQEICEIENEIQTDLDKFSSGGIRFKIDITSEKTLELIFTRQYRDGEIDWLNYDSKTIYCTDAKIITGHGFDGFRVPVYWGGVPYGYPFFMPKEEFINCYKKSAIKLGGSRLNLQRLVRCQIRLFLLWHIKEKGR